MCVVAGIGDIDVIAALGDSLTAASGASSVRVTDLVIENRGLSWSIGGQWSFNNSTTLPNILKGKWHEMLISLVCEKFRFSICLVILMPICVSLIFKKKQRQTNKQTNSIQSKLGGLFQTRCMDLSFGQSVKFSGNRCIISGYAIYGQNAGATHQTG